MIFFYFLVLILYFFILIFYLKILIITFFDDCIFIFAICKIALFLKKIFSLLVLIYF